MARKLRIQFPGAIYHVVSRGNHREDIFRDDLDRESFLKTLGDTCEKTGWQVHAFCLMPNHFHLVVETPQPNLVAGMKWFLGTYTTRFNRRHKVTGHLFAGRYKSMLVAGEGGYLRTACDYVHLNPVRARLLTPEGSMRSYRWSSFGLFLLAPDHRPGWLRVDRLLGECGIPTDSAAGRKEFEQRLEARRHQEEDEEFRSVRRGWCLGDEQFRRELLAQVEGKAGKNHFGEELQEVAEAKATRIINEELRHAVWTESDLTRRRKGDPIKIHMASRLRAQTTVTLQWIAARLSMGTQAHLKHLLYWQKRAEREQVTISEAKRAFRQRAHHGGQSRVSADNRSEPARRSVVRRGPSRMRRVLPEDRLSPKVREPYQSIPLTDPHVFDPGSD